MHTLTGLRITERVKDGLGNKDDGRKRSCKPPESVRQCNSRYRADERERAAHSESACNSRGRNSIFGGNCGRALARSLELSETLGIHTVVVDAIDAEAKAFYQRLGFLPLVDDQMRLFLSVGTIRSAARQ